ncbi:HEPN domain-containing protein [bacterium]|nr:HEPN domain-containing protein [bacterium]MCI0697352.1 HEPN domain-containing protein [candidate division KSB1 bacterium]
MDRKNPQIAAIEFYPKRIADGLILIRDLIVDKFQPEMIILFGSLVTGKWTWKSDIDLLIVADTSERPHLELDIKTAILESDAIKKKMSKIVSPVVVSPEQLNDQLAVGQYFFKDIVDRGQLIYNTGRFSLAEMRELEPEEYVELVKKDFNYWREEAEGYWKTYKFQMQEKLLRFAAFSLHQVTESSCVMVELVYSRYRTQTHDLDILLKKLIHFVSEGVTIFPKENEFQKQAYKRLYKAYISARYDQEYQIEEDELKYLGERVKMLLDLAIKSCEERIQQILREPNKYMKK